MPLRRTRPITIGRHSPIINDFKHKIEMNLRSSIKVSNDFASVAFGNLKKNYAEQC